MTASISVTWIIADAEAAEHAALALIVAGGVHHGHHQFLAGELSRVHTRKSLAPPVDGSAAKQTLAEVQGALAAGEEDDGGLGGVGPDEEVSLFHTLTGLQDHQFLAGSEG
jgi:hypothetical protein